MTDRPVLSFDAVERRFGRGGRAVSVLRGCSFVVEAGGFLGIHGSRRSGKTTVLRLAAGIDVADAGVIRCCGAELARLSASGRARLRGSEIGFVPGMFSVDGSVAAGSRCGAVVEHVSLPLIGAGRSPRDAEFVADRVLDRLGASDYADAAIHELTAVERARVALARALVRAPRLLLVDDPAPTQDADDREEITAMLEVLGSDPALTLVVASTEVDVLRGASRLATLSEGTVQMPAHPGTLIPFPQRSPEGSLVP